jgi:hypothetical protein
MTTRVPFTLDSNHTKEHHSYNRGPLPFFMPFPIAC